MRVVRTVFLDIHYALNEREKANNLAQRYEKRGYSREVDGEMIVDGEDCIQLLKTTIPRNPLREAK